MKIRRRNRGLLARPEAIALDVMIRRIPNWVTPDILTGLGIVGGAIAALGFFFALSHPAWCFVAIIGLAINWFGDSLDGKLARHRNDERPISGFILDNGLDLAIYFLFALAFATSGLVWAPLPFVLFALFVMLANLAMVRTMLTQVQELSFGMFGTTEIRVAFAVLAIALAVMPAALVRPSFPGGYSVVDAMSVAWALLMAWGYMATLMSDLRSHRRLGR